MTCLKKLSYCVCILLLVPIVTAWWQVVDVSDILLKAELEGRPIPVLSLQYPPMNVNMAYQVQRSYAEKRIKTDRIAGFKAGLTSKGAQKTFGVDAPLAGVLFESGKLSGEVTIDSDHFHQLMLETEIGFVVGQAIYRPLTDVMTLKKHITTIMPVIELPDLGFADMKNLKGTDIIAANVSARQFLVGRERPVDGFDPNAVTVTLSLDGREVNAGKGTDTLGDQWQAALWLVNMMLEQGWTMEPGQIIITGALGNMVPGKPGEYAADYGDFGKIEFTIE